MYRSMHKGVIPSSPLSPYLLFQNREQRGRLIRAIRVIRGFFIRVFRVIRLLQVPMKIVDLHLAGSAPDLVLPPSVHSFSECCVGYSTERPPREILAASTAVPANNAGGSSRGA